MSDPSATVQGEKERDEMFRMFNVYIDYMRHENDLLNQRTTWFVNSQAALILVASYLLQKYVEVFGKFVLEGHHFKDLQDDQRAPIVLLLVFWIAVCLIGALTAGMAWRSIQAAIQAQLSIDTRWNDRFFTRADSMGLPKLRGGGDSDAGKKGGDFARMLPPVLLGLWLLFVFVAMSFVTIRV